MAQTSCGLIVLSSSTGLHLASTCRPGSREMSSNEPRLELRLVHRNLRASSPTAAVDDVVTVNCICRWSHSMEEILYSQFPDEVVKVMCQFLFVVFTGRG